MKAPERGSDPCHLSVLLAIIPDCGCWSVSTTWPAMLLDMYDTNNIWKQRKQQKRMSCKRKLEGVENKQWRVRSKQKRLPAFMMVGEHVTWSWCVIFLSAKPWYTALIPHSSTSHFCLNSTHFAQQSFSSHCTHGRPQSWPGVPWRSIQEPVQLLHGHC
jgi:hypothetical protein